MRGWGNIIFQAPAHKLVVFALSPSLSTRPYRHNTHAFDIRTHIVTIFDSLLHPRLRRSPRPRRSLSSDISARRRVEATRSSSMLPATDVSDGDTPAGAILTSPASIGGAPARPRLSVSPAKSQRGPDEAAESTIQSDTALTAFAVSGGVRLTRNEFSHGSASAWGLIPAMSSSDASG